MDTIGTVAAATPTPAPDLGALFDTVLKQIKGQALTDLKVPALTMIDNVLATPTTQNVVGQGGQFYASLLPLLPLLEGQGITDVFTALKTAIQNAGTSSTTA